MGLRSFFTGFSRWRFWRFFLGSPTKSANPATTPASSNGMPPLLPHQRRRKPIVLARKGFLGIKRRRSKVRSQSKGR